MVGLSMGDWLSSLNRRLMCTAGCSTCMRHWLASLCSTIQMCSLQVMPCSRVFRQLALPLVVANVPNLCVIVLQQSPPAVRQGLKGNTRANTCQSTVDQQGYGIRYSMQSMNLERQDSSCMYLVHNGQCYSTNASLVLGREKSSIARKLQAKVMLC